MASIKELEKNKIEIEFEISQELLKQASLKAVSYTHLDVYKRQRLKLM